MKNKRIMIVVVFVLISIGCLLTVYFMSQRPTEPQTPSVDSFSLSMYQWEVGAFPMDTRVNPIDGKKDAVETAISLWLEKYNVVIHMMTVDVSYDSNEKCWHIYGSSSMSSNVLGGGFHALIRNDGDVLAVWRDD